MSSLLQLIPIFPTFGGAVLRTFEHHHLVQHHTHNFSRCLCDLENMQFLFAIVVLALIGTVLSYHGVDVSQATSQSDFSCMKSNGYSFAIVRVYCSSGHTDSNGPTTMHNAWNGGMSHVDGYIFPCYSCGNPAKQVNFEKIYFGLI